ncbi:hypothetical protein RFI_14216 [Reticulomyxa filosa]|uniref:Uncharacterized protein n=1 Tax=Reticulomyxa filosa TaxID=46433 RepID=X6N9J6_RETFI|nr:hypothetical protein RFI_14216 [Reticulomyxa filosa]|eukprot:ETO22960.1 hypothetical protein RFI_14216 [Reticulomyxa filosa]
MKVITHDFQFVDTCVLKTDHRDYVITREHALYQSKYVPMTKDELQEKHDRVFTEDRTTEVRFKDMRDFLKESDFFGYVCDFLRCQSTFISNVLVIACDPLLDQDMLMHHAHGQYLIEKALSTYSKSVKDASGKMQTKTIIMLCYR